MKEIMLMKCETDIEYVEDCLGNLIGFTQLYEAEAQPLRCRKLQKII